MVFCVVCRVRERTGNSGSSNAAVCAEAAGNVSPPFCQSTFIQKYSLCRVRSKFNSSQTIACVFWLHTNTKRERALQRVFMMRSVAFSVRARTPPAKSEDAATMCISIRSCSVCLLLQAKGKVSVNSCNDWMKTKGTFCENACGERAVAAVIACRFAAHCVFFPFALSRHFLFCFDAAAELQNVLDSSVRPNRAQHIRDVDTRYSRTHEGSDAFACRQRRDLDGDMPCSANISVDNIRCVRHRHANAMYSDSYMLDSVLVQEPW